jgi:hypothetical protein
VKKLLVNHSTVRSVPLAFVLCDGISVVTEFVANHITVRSVPLAFNFWMEFTVSTGRGDNSRGQMLDHTHGSASSGAKV